MPSHQPRPTMPATHLLLLLLLLPLNIQNTFASDISLTFLHGDSFVVEPDRQSTATLEYVTRWNQGDLFAFVDYKDYHQGDPGYGWYGEISPRFKIMDGKLPLYAAFTWERGKNNTEAYLGGIGTDLTLTGFRFVKINAYYRDSPNQNGHGWQSTVSWALPLLSEHWLLDGYIDWIFSTEESAPNVHFNPQLKWDLQKALHTRLRWFVGLEYDYWDKKYGIDTNAMESRQNTASVLLKIHF